MCLQGKESSAGGDVCLAPANIWGHLWYGGRILCTDHWVLPRIALLSWVVFGCFSFVFFFFSPPAPPPMAAANAEPQCCWLLTSRGWWEKNLGHLHGQRGLGVQHGQRQNGVSGLSLTLLLTDE